MIQVVNFILTAIIWPRYGQTYRCYTMKMKMQVLLRHWHLFMKQHGITHRNKQNTYGNLKLKHICFIFWVVIGSRLLQCMTKDPTAFVKCKWSLIPAWIQVLDNVCIWHLSQYSLCWSAPLISFLPSLGLPKTFYKLE